MKKLLLVDDSNTVRAICRRCLDGESLEVLEAENGQKALEVVRANPDIEAVLLDWNMPVMNGLEFLEALRAEPLPKQPRVVMCTTENSMDQIMQAIKAGADEYVMKPFTEDIVREKLLGVTSA